MPEESFDEKTEKATPRKRSETREKGEVAKSREVPSVAVLLASLVTLTIFGSYMYAHIQTMMKGAFSLPIPMDPDISDFLGFALETITLFIMTIMPLLVAVFITAVFSNIIQVGFIFSGHPIKPKWSKLDPIKGSKRLFSKQSLMELFKTLAKLAIVGGVAYISVKGEMKSLNHLADMEPNAIITYILTTLFKISIKCILPIIFLVIIDYAFQRWEFEKQLKMSKKEVKDEFKRTEGDPLIKSRIKSIQMQMARKRMMQAVPEADVVITNPTHLAVAIKYDSSVMNAPKVLAKGAGSIAQRIKDLAEKHDVPIVEDRELARNLYSSAEIDQEIPSILYQAVAGILAYVYKLKGRHASGMV